MGGPAEGDPILRSTCEQIVTLIAQAVDAEPAQNHKVLMIPGGFQVGRQIAIDATEPGGTLNLCRLSILNVHDAPAGEAARIEYEHDKAGKFETRRVYSVQSVRRRGEDLVLLENFLAISPETVREEDFRAISSEAYAQTVVKSVQDWTRYRAWQLQTLRHK